jgi:hypothetical protein
MNILKISMMTCLLGLGSPALAEDAKPEAPKAAVEAPKPEASKAAVEAPKPEASNAAVPSNETNCTDGIDNDGDGLQDCGDNDCYEKAVCKSDGGPENTDVRCSDWIDNDEDGYVDCSDKDCLTGVVKVCKGSWKGPLSQAGAQPSTSNEDLPALGAGETVEDLIGKHGDKDGERNDQLCSDGIDNDKDGRTDCADFGCRFDPNVSVCRGNPGMRFSIVGNISMEYDLANKAFDTRFSKLQLRSFGPMPFIQDSFYLVSMRTEKTPRLTFAMFQVPLGDGHFVNVNSGGGGLSNGMVLSSAKNLLLDPAFYLYSAFDQGNGAAVEFSGPVDTNGLAFYRAYVAGGSGLFTGNVGGRYFSYDNTNFTYGGGVTLQLNILGHHNRWDSQFLYTSASPVVALALGVKYDQRAQERYTAMNARLFYRWSNLIGSIESYTKREFEFQSWQTSYNVTLGYLIWPRHLMLGIDYGQFIAGDMELPPAQLETELKRQKNETMWRAALHWYFFRNVGVATLLYRDRKLSSNDPANPETEEEREMRLEIQYRF